jgi:hypothetical protein
VSNLSWNDRPVSARNGVQFGQNRQVREAGTVEVTSDYLYRVFASRMDWLLSGLLAAAYKENRTRNVLKRIQRKGLLQSVEAGVERRWVATEFLASPSMVQAKVLAQFR